MKKLILPLVTTVVLASACGPKQIIKEANPNLDPAVSPRVSASPAADALTSQQWSTQTLGLESVWKSGGASNRRVQIAIVSSGVDYNHPDLRNNLTINMTELEGSAQDETKSLAVNKTDGKDSDGNGYIDDVVGYDFVEGDGYAFDRSGHGTAIAGVIGAVHENGTGIRGVMREVGLIPVRYIDPNGMATLPRMIDALKYASASNADVVYLHLAGVSLYEGGWFETEEEIKAIQEAETRALSAVVSELERKGVPLVVSAGNNGQNVDGKNRVLDILRRSSLSVVVTSTDNRDQKPFVANYGPQTVDLGAPGSQVLTTLPGGKYEEQSGSYLAAAYVAGAIGAGVSKSYGTVTAARLISTLKGAAGGDDVPSLETNTVSGRRLNVQKFLNAL